MHHVGYTHACSQMPIVYWKINGSKMVVINVISVLCGSYIVIAMEKENKGLFFFCSSKVKYATLRFDGHLMLSD